MPAEQGLLQFSPVKNFGLFSNHWFHQEPVPDRGGRERSVIHYCREYERHRRKTILMGERA